MKNMTKKEEIEKAVRRIKAYKPKLTRETCLKQAKEQIEKSIFENEYMEKIRKEEEEEKPKKKECIQCGETHINKDDFCDECQEAFDKIKKTNG